MYLKIEIPFDENIYMRQCMVRWSLSNKKNFKNVKSILIGWACVFTIGILTGIEREQYINGYTIIGTIILTYAIGILIHLLNGKRKYKKLLIEMAKTLKSKNNFSEYEFTDSFIRYIDNQRDIKLNWDVFDSYTISNKDILINQNHSFDFSYVLGKDELTTTNYEELKDFLSTKLKLKGV